MNLCCYLNYSSTLIKCSNLMEFKFYNLICHYQIIKKATKEFKVFHSLSNYYNEYLNYNLITICISTN